MKNKISTLKKLKNEEELKMTASIGLYFVIFILVMIPMVFLGAGKDTTRQRAEKKQRQKEVLLDWTDKELLHMEESYIPEAASVSYTAPHLVEIKRITWEVAGKPAA